MLVCYYSLRLAPRCHASTLVAPTYIDLFRRGVARFISSCINSSHVRVVGKKQSVQQLTMSEYLQSLQAPAKTRYIQKLNVLGLDDTQSDDPYCDATASKFRDDMTLWPPVEFGHIFGYFVSRPGLYTQEQLLAWKQLNAYN